MNFAVVKSKKGFNSIVYKEHKNFCLIIEVKEFYFKLNAENDKIINEEKFSNKVK